MDHQWERKSKVETISLETANQLFHCFDRHANVESIELLSGGLINTNYKLNTNGHKHAFVLRIYPAEYEACVREARITEMLSSGACVPNYRYHCHEPALFARPFAIIDFIEGETLNRALSDGRYQSERQLFASIGERLAWIHSHEYPNTGYIDENNTPVNEYPPFETWYDLFLNDDTERRLGNDLTRRIRRHLATSTELLDQIKERIALIHSDFRPANIMVRDGSLVGILDWEFSGVDHTITDIGQFIRIEEQIGPLQEKPFIEAYQGNALNPLPENWRTLARLRDLVNLLQKMSSKEDSIPMHQHMRLMIERTVQEWD